MSHATRRWTFAALAALFLIAWLWWPRAAADLQTGDSWMFAGSYSWRSGEGIYLFRFRPSTGALQSRGLAAGPLWRANRGAWGGSLARLIAQFRDGWPSARTIWKGVQNPSFLAVHPGGRYLYSADENARGAVSAFEIDAANGKLIPLNTQPSGGARPCYVTTDREGKNLLVANYGGSVAVLPIAADGRLGDAASVVSHQGGGAHAHSIDVSPDNRFAIAADLGLDQIRVYRFDAAAGKLAPLDGGLVQLPRGTLPRHTAFHPGGEYLYVVGESSRVVAMKWDGATGVLTPFETISTVPAGYQGAGAAAEIAVHPDGRFVYVSNRGPNNIAVFAVDPGSGHLRPIQYVSTQGGPPSSFAIGRDGEGLFVANVLTNNIVEFRINRQTGELAAAGVSVPAAAPSGLQFASIRSR